ncbi:MAG: methyltransferase family protein [Acidimicrobiales bacterium]
MRSILPPTLVVILAAVAVVVGSFAPVVSMPPGWWRALGVIPVIAGLALAKRSSSLFEQQNTNVHTFRDPDKLVDTGAFAWSRNPMYLGFATALSGVAVVVGGLSAWVAPIVFVIAADRWYIPFEEHRMAECFGSGYDRYRQGTRRWIGRR